MTLFASATFKIGMPQTRDAGLVLCRIDDVVGADHPGMAKTDLMVNGPGKSRMMEWMDKLLSPIAGRSA
jgi:hypothetical protein